MHELSAIAAATVVRRGLIKHTQHNDHLNASARYGFTGAPIGSAGRQEAEHGTDVISPRLTDGTDVRGWQHAGGAANAATPRQRTCSRDGVLFSGDTLLFNGGLVPRTQTSGRPAIIASTKEHFSDSTTRRTATYRHATVIMLPYRDWIELRPLSLSRAQTGRRWKATLTTCPTDVIRGRCNEYPAALEG